MVIIPRELLAKCAIVVYGVSHTVIVRIGVVVSEHGIYGATDICNLVSVGSSRSTFRWPALSIGIGVTGRGGMEVTYNFKHLPNNRFHSFDILLRFLPLCVMGNQLARV
jgi:hypothetical protein